MIEEDIEVWLRFLQGFKILLGIFLQIRRNDSIRESPCPDGTGESLRLGLGRQSTANIRPELERVVEVGEVAAEKNPALQIIEA